MAIDDLTARDLMLLAAIVGGQTLTYGKAILEIVTDNPTIENYERIMVTIMRAEAKALVEFVREIERLSETNKD